MSAASGFPRSQTAWQMHLQIQRSSSLLTFRQQLRRAARSTVGGQAEQGRCFACASAPASAQSLRSFSGTSSTSAYTRTRPRQELAGRLPATRDTWTAQARRYSTNKPSSSPGNKVNAKQSDAKSASPSYRGYIIAAVVGVLGFAAQYTISGNDPNNRISRARKASSGSEGDQPVELNLDTFQPLKVIRSDLSTSLMLPDERGDGVHKHVRLSLEGAKLHEDGNDKQAETPMRIESIYIMQPDIQIERAYTPLLSKKQSEASGCIDLLVKRYEDGEMGRYIQRMPVGGSLECRGWSTTWDAKWYGPEKKFRHIYFLVAGTGITPAFQFIASQLGQLPSDPANTKISILYAAPKPSSFLLLPELSTLQRTYADQLDVSLWAEDISEAVQKERQSSSLAFLSSLWPTKVHTWHDLPMRKGRIQLDDVKRIIDGAQRNSVVKSTSGPLNDDSIVLVCGPDGFVAAMAGLRSRDGRTQGPLRGILAKLGLSPQQVFKL